jgi:uncharacterized protein YbaA (DUF1428 family)
MGMGFAGFVYGRLERGADALDIARDLERLGDQTYERIAVIHAGLRDRDEAFAWLERAYEARSPGMSEVMVDPRMDDLRSDSRFDSLVRRMGLR